MTKLNRVLLISSFLGIFYLAIFMGFLNPEVLPTESTSTPQLKERLGTTLWHSSTNSGEAHIYCYYPGNQANKVNNDFLLKRVREFNDCQNWHGIVIFQENQDVSEEQKYQIGA